MLSIAEQDTAQLGGSKSVLARQKRDHMRLRDLLQKLGDARPGQAEQLILLDIYRLVFPHAFAEEAVLWPAIRRTVPGGEELTLRVEQEHQAINELVRRLEALRPASSEYHEVLTRVVHLLAADVGDEEDILLPQLQAVLSPMQLRRLGLAWEAVRRVAPTRAHPLVSRRPPGNILSALPLSLLDRLRDRLDTWSYRQPNGEAPLLAALSAGLGRTATVVERLPLMRAGEDRSTRRVSRSGLSWTTAALVGFAAAGVFLRFRFKSTRSAAGRAQEIGSALA